MICCGRDGEFSLSRLALGRNRLRTVSMKTGPAVPLLLFGILLLSESYFMMAGMQTRQPLFRVVFLYCAAFVYALNGFSPVTRFLEEQAAKQ
jgi:hypothetical protein